MDLDSKQQAELKLLFTKKDGKKRGDKLFDKITICGKFKNLGKGEHISLANLISQEYNNLTFINSKFCDCRMYSMYANKWLFIKSLAKYCNFGQSEFTDSMFVYSNLEKTTFGQGILDGVVIFDCNLVEAILEGVSLKNATLISVDLSRANLKNAILDGAVIYDCKLILSQMYNIKTNNTIFRSNQLYNDYLYEKIKFGIRSFRFKYGFKIQKRQLKKSRFNNKNNNNNLNSDLEGHLNWDTFIDVILYTTDGEYIPHDLERVIYSSPIDSLKEEYKDSIIKYAGTMDVNEYIGDNMKKQKIYQYAIKNYKCATWIYNALYELSNQNGEYELADEILYRMNETKNKLKKVIVLHELTPIKDKSSETPKRNSIKRIYNIIKNSSLVAIYELLKVFCGYGLKPIRAAITSLGIIVLFSILYNITRCIEIQGKTNTNIGFLNSLYFSIVTFTSLGYANMQPNIAMGVSKLLVAAESLLGVLLLSLVIYSITMQARSK